MTTFKEAEVPASAIKWIKVIKTGKCPVSAPSVLLDIKMTDGEVVKDLDPSILNWVNGDFTHYAFGNIEPQQLTPAQDCNAWSVLAPPYERPLLYTTHVDLQFKHIEQIAFNVSVDNVDWTSGNVTAYRVHTPIMSVPLLAPAEWVQWLPGCKTPDFTCDTIFDLKLDSVAIVVAVKASIVDWGNSDITHYRISDHIQSKSLETWHAVQPYRQPRMYAKQVDLKFKSGRQVLQCETPLIHWDVPNIRGYRICDTSEPVQEYTKLNAKIINKYSREIKPGVYVDVYDVLKAFNVTCPALQHAIKKLLAPGERGSKDVKTDLDESVSAINRAIDFVKSEDC